MTLMMRDLENREEGRSEGRKEGREEEQRNVIETMLRNGNTPQEIADFLKYPMKLIEEVQNSLLISV